MRKITVWGLVVFYAVPFLILFLNPLPLNIYIKTVYNADLLYPFSLYQGLFHPGTDPNWVFGGYTPFLELFAGLVFWLIARNIQNTFLLYALFQPLLLTFSLVFLARQIFGKNLKVLSLVVVASAVPLYLYVYGLFPSGWYLFCWYSHVTTAALGWFALGLTIRLVSARLGLSRADLPDLFSLALLIVLAVLSDALFIAQFAAPILAVIVLAFLIKALAFRKVVYLVLTVLYAVAGGLALYRLPSLWGSDRLVFYGSYIKPGLPQMLGNLGLIVQVIPSAWERLPLVSLLWLLFYALCLIWVGASVLRRSFLLGGLRKKLCLLFSFLLLQLLANIASGLMIVTDPGVRYFLPITFGPLFWSWPFLFAAFPRLLRAVNGKALLGATMAPPALAILCLVTSPFSIPNLVASASAQPDFVACLDKGAGTYHLKNGMANYWQARPVTLFSRTGLVVVQADPDLAPYRILNNWDGYANPFDFVIISNDDYLVRWIGREVVLDHFGSPAASFFCGKSEILVYNRPADSAVRQHFQTYLPRK